MCKALLCCLVLCMMPSAVLRAQFDVRMYRTGYVIDSVRTGELHVGVENISFFQDNEFAGKVMSGYTLPGLWLQPKVTYQPLKNVLLEVGLHALVYHGAYEYPNYSYRDIADWKGDQYQHGSHLLPYFRAQLQLQRCQLVLGNLYGGGNHRLIEPLYSSELNLTADPEAGFQLLYDAPRFHFDAWVNWESFIFRQDLHREAFTVGISAEVCYNAPRNLLHFYSPVQIVLQHRGGEIDNDPDDVSTLMNGAVGIGLRRRLQRPRLKQFFAEADVLGYYQQHGNAWPLGRGCAGYAQTGMLLGTNADWEVRGGYFYGKDFISLFGLPFFGTVSTKFDGAVFDCMHTAYLSADYSHRFGNVFTLGAQASLYLSAPGSMTADGVQASVGVSTSYSFGIFFRTDLDFLVKRFK